MFLLMFITEHALFLHFDLQEENGMMDETPQSMYMFEGHDYSKETRDTSAADKDAFQTLLECELLLITFI